MSKELITSCKFTFRCKLATNSAEIGRHITDKLHFKISRWAPLTVEKDGATQQNINDLFELLKEQEEYVIVNESDFCKEVNEQKISGNKIIGIESAQHPSYSNSEVEKSLIDYDDSVSLPSNSCTFIDNSDIVNSMGQRTLNDKREYQKCAKQTVDQNNYDSSQNVSSRDSPEQTRKLDVYDKHPLPSDQELIVNGTSVTEVKVKSHESEFTSKKNGNEHENMRTDANGKIIITGNLKYDHMGEYNNSLSLASNGLLYKNLSSDVTDTTNQDAESHSAAESVGVMSCDTQFNQSEMKSTKNQSEERTVKQNLDAGNKLSTEIEVKMEMLNQAVQESDEVKKERTEEGNKRGDTFVKCDLFNSSNKFMEQVKQEEANVSGKENVVYNEKNSGQRNQTESHNKPENNTGGTLDMDDSYDSSSLINNEKHARNSTHNAERHKESQNECEDRPADTQNKLDYDDSASQTKKERTEVTDIDKPEQYKSDKSKKLTNLKDAHGNSAEKQIAKGKPESKQEGNKNKLHKQTASDKQLQQSKYEDEESTSELEDVIKEIHCSMTELSFLVAKDHFMDTKYRSYFDKAEREPTGGFTFKLNERDEKDVKFKKQLQKLKFEKVEFEPEIKDYVISVVEKIKSGISGLFLNVKGNRIHIIGAKDVVPQVKKKIVAEINVDNKTSPLPPRNSQRNEEILADSRLSDINRKCGTQEEITRAERSNDNNRSLELQQLAMYSNVQKPYSTRFDQEASSFHGQYNKYINVVSFTSHSSRMKIRIYQANITELEVDCIVNAANRRLQHGGGVAKAISKAAGEAMQKECGDFIMNGKPLDVTDIFKSTGGKLHAKYIIHAVGPKWDAYDFKNKPMCFEDLRHTVLRCLVEATRCRMTSIAFPSISAAIFKVPKEECARCYMEAVKHFDLVNTEERERGTLQEIHFVDVDDNMVNTIKECFTKNWSEECDLRNFQIDRDFVKQHCYSKQKMINAKSLSGQDKKFVDDDRSRSRSSSGLTKTPVEASAGGTTRKYDNNAFYLIGKITLCVINKPALNLRSEVIITVGKPFSKLSGLDGFTLSGNVKEKKEMPFKKKAYQFLDIYKPGGKRPRLLCTVYPEPDDEGSITEAFKNLEAAFQNFYAQSMTKIVLTSSVLYAEPRNKSKKEDKSGMKKNKIYGKFAKAMYDSLNKITTKTQIDIFVTVVGSEDAVISIEKVIESRGHQKRSSDGASKYSHGRGNTREYGAEDHESNQTRYTERNLTQSVQDVQNSKDDWKMDIGSPVDAEGACAICAQNKPCWPLICCKNLLCQDCEQKMAMCPYCRKIWRNLTGDQPPGTMSVTTTYPDFWEIEYNFPSGRQQENHPHPGRKYFSTRRTAYLPISDDGFQVLILLRLAFIRKLTFTIGNSLTKDQEDSITWNDIHHKTSLHGGPFGYPDRNYFDRVTLELANRGVTTEFLTESERRQLEDFSNRIQNFKNYHE